MDLIRQFLHQIAQIHSIEEGYLRRHADLFGIHYGMIHNERALMWDLQNRYPTPLLRIQVWLPALELPAEYDVRESLDQLSGFFYLCRGAAQVMLEHPIVGTLAQILFARYDSAVWFVDDWRRYHLPLTFKVD
jgi:hypothetical protein